jgi:hypothetical protein
MAESDSIFNSIKKVLNVGPEDTDFDTDILMHINSVFSILQQLGIGPEAGFYIDGPDPTWADYLGADSLHISMVRSYMAAKVRILFDPPVSSSVMESLNRTCTEFEWRANVAAENKALEDEKNESDTGD